MEKKIDYDKIPLHKNETEKRFEIDVDGSIAFIDYREMGNQISLIHTETAPDLKGKGAATAVVEKTLKYAAGQNKTVFPFCPYIFAFIKKHPEWKYLVNKGFKGYDKL